MNITDKKWVDAIYKPRWILFTWKYTDWNVIYFNFLSSLYKELNSRKEISSIYITRFQVDENEFKVNIAVNTSMYHVEEIRKFVFEEFDKYKGSSFFALESKYDQIEFKDYHIFSGLGASKLLYESILPITSNCLLSFMAEFGENFDLETALEKSIPITLGLLHAAGLEKDQMHLFYDYFFNLQLRHINTVETNDELRDNYINEVRKNYLLQKDAFIGISDYLSDALLENEMVDEDWINEWFGECRKIREQVIHLPEHMYIASFNFQPDEDSKLDLLTQKKFNIIQSLLSEVHWQTGITYV